MHSIVESTKSLGPHVTASPRVAKASHQEYKRLHVLSAVVVVVIVVIVVVVAVVAVVVWVYTAYWPYAQHLNR